VNYKLIALLVGCLVGVTCLLQGFTDFGEDGLTAREWVGSIVLGLLFAAMAWWTDLHAMRWLVKKGHLPEEED